jgi:hypothetical protein
MKLIEKTKINSRYKKKYDAPQTPYHRLLKSGHISDEAKEALKVQHQRLNPFALKRIIDQKVKRILQMVSVTSSMRQRC